MQEISFSIPDAVRASGISRSALYLLIAAGKIDARKAGKRTLIVAESLRAYVANLPPAPARAA